VVTAFFQFDHSPTAVTSLPTRLLRCFEKSVRLLIFWTILDAVPLPIAKAAYLCLTPTALPIFLTVLLMYVARLDPFATSSSRTIYTILGRIFRKLCVPVLLKFVVK
jgi:hypothetical protein